MEVGMSVIEILESLESDGSRNAKEAILNPQVGNDLLRRFFGLASDPWKNWGVTKYDRPKVPGPLGHGDDLVTEFLDLLIRLDRRELKGNAARKAVSDIIASGDSLAQKWLERLLWRNLRCGVSSTTVNKVWPGTVVPFGVALAGTLPTKGVNGNFVFSEPVTYPVRVEAKLDGLRCIAVKYGGEVTMYTRNGTVLETLPRIKAAIEALPGDDFVLDGEAMGEDWNESASVVMSAKSKKDDSTMRYHVFDWVPFTDWQAQSTNLTYHERLQNLVATIGADPMMSQGPFRYVKSKVCSNETELRDFYASCLDENYEGVMLKDMAATYKWKRSSAILKLKPVATEEGVVVGWYSAADRTKRAGQFGGFKILTSNGVVTRVGGGYTDKLKDQIFNEGPDTYIGRIAECEHQPPFTPDGKMRFPVFCRFRDPSDVDPKVMAAYDSWIGSND
jgi:DNA ligase-1